MKPESIDRVFWQAAQLADDDRDAYLDRACAGDVGLRRKLEQLLAARTEAAAFLEAGAVRPAVPGRACAVSEGPGTVIGPYKLLEQIGEGGFGVVFMAEQQEPIRRKVALKVLKPGMDSRQVVARFEAERQALALMDHPNVATILDAGQTASGRPYFVMELVKGVPVTDYCDQARLTVRERLELFAVVCRAVQHAHQKAIIHRDIKPSNVLITLHDGTPVVKVIDFGIAKARGQALTDKTLFTGFAQLVGTPLYMSPEQAALSGLDVDTRSDVYSLGVLLYELLTGTTPFDRERLATAAYDEIRRIIREEEPARPSAQMTTLGRAAATVSANRRSDTRRLYQLFRGELDWIVLKALEKDRNRRYDSANALALDVERYLRDEPVQACPPSAVYRLGKFARRHRLGLTAAGLLLIALALPGGAAFWAMSDRAARSAATEQEVRRALDEAATLQGQGKCSEALGAARRAEGLLAGGGGRALRDRVRQVREDLEMVLRLEETRFPDAADGVEANLIDRSATEARIARAFREYGIDLASLDPGEAAERVRSRPIRHELVAALDHWIQVRTSTPAGNRRDDDGLRERLLAVARLADPDGWRNQVRDDLVRRDVEALRKLAASGRVSELPVYTLSLLGNVLEGAGANRESVRVMRLAQQQYPDDAEINFQLGWALDHRPGPAADPEGEVVRFYTVARALRPRNLALHRFLAEALIRRGQPVEAAAVYRKAVELSPDDVRQHCWLAVAQLAAGDRAGYRGTCAAMLDRFGRTDQGDVAQAVVWTVVLDAESVADPERPVRLAEAALRRSPTGEGSAAALGAALYRAGRLGDAVRRLGEVDVAAREAAPQPALYSPAHVWLFLAMAHRRLGDGVRARGWLAKATDRADREARDKGLPWTRLLTLRLLRREAGAVVRGTHDIRTMHITPDGRWLLAHGEDKTVRRWDLRNIRPGVTQAPTRTLENSIGMKLVRIPAGRFRMGSPVEEKGRRADEQQHDVRIARPFYLGVYEVTQGEFETVMGFNPSHFAARARGRDGAAYLDWSRPGGGKDKVEGLGGTGRFPVENGSWDEAVEFCNKLSALPAERKAKRTYRLPSEAEWEYACRGGAPSYQVFHVGDRLSSAQANFRGTAPYGGGAVGPWLLRTCKVGSYQPNAFGLYDMHGNVWEWCADRYARDDHARVRRGGCWVVGGTECRSAVRRRRVPDDRRFNLGFRVALVLSNE